MAGEARLSGGREPRVNDLKCPGVGRDAENDRALCFYLNRSVTDDEMRFLHEVMQRAVACMPEPERPTLTLVKS